MGVKVEGTIKASSPKVKVTNINSNNPTTISFTTVKRSYDHYEGLLSSPITLVYGAITEPETIEISHGGTADLDDIGEF